ncbi:MAG: hypothetical protein HUU54_15540 [Ignavibacteriaceae bacterium]|nr:hypothetical protein [Ignavibacteriaceae bacterium]
MINCKWLIDISNNSGACGDAPFFVFERWNADDADVYGFTQIIINADQRELPFRAYRFISLLYIGTGIRVLPAERAFR